MARHRWLLFGGGAALAGVAFAGAVLVTAGPALFNQWFSPSQCRAAAAVDAAAEPFGVGAVAAFQRIEPRDAANLALFLAADDSRMITNQHFVIDGGRI